MRKTANCKDSNDPHHSLPNYSIGFATCVWPFTISPSSFSLMRKLSLQSFPDNNPVLCYVSIKLPLLRMLVDLCKYDLQLHLHMSPLNVSNVPVPLWNPFIPQHHPCNLARQLDPWFSSLNSLQKPSSGCFRLVWVLRDKPVSIKKKGRSCNWGSVVSKTESYC